MKDERQQKLELFSATRTCGFGTPGLSGTFVDEFGVISLV